MAFVTNLLGFTVTTALIRRFETVSPERAAAALHWVLLLSVAGMLAFAFAPSFWLAALLSVLYGVLSGLYSPLYTAWLNHGLDSRSRATVNSMAAQADALGQLGFGPLFGLLGNLTGVRSALLLAALVRLPLLAVMRRVARKA